MSSTLPSSRRHHILERVRRDGEAHVGALAAELEVSSITVRRDIAALAEEGLIEQVRGGARLPRTAASALSAPASAPPGRRPRLAMIVPSLRYYWSSIIDGARHSAARLGADLAVHASTANAEANLMVLEQVVAAGDVDALLIAPEMRAGEASERLVARICELPLPVVLTERGVEGHGPVQRQFDTVRSDHTMGAAMAVRHLAALGHRRIAYAGIPTTPTHDFITGGYRRAVELMGLDRLPDQPAHIDPGGDAPFGTIDAMLARYRELGVTAALVHSDVAATLTLQHALRRGWSIPGDLSLVAYDDELSATTRPALTAVAPAKTTLGRRAVELALARLADPEAPIEHVTLVPALRVRETSGPPPARTRSAAVR